MFVFGNNQGYTGPKGDVGQIPLDGTRPVIGVLSNNTIAIAPASVTVIIRHLQNP